MLLNVRSIAVSAGVICFFAVGLIGYFNGLVPLTCCKRALTGAIVAYVVVTLAVKAINAVLTSALVETQVRKLREEAYDHRD